MKEHDVGPLREGIIRIGGDLVDCSTRHSLMMVIWEISILVGADIGDRVSIDAKVVQKLLPIAVGGLSWVAYRDGV